MSEVFYGDRHRISGTIQVDFWRFVGVDFVVGEVGNNGINITLVGRLFEVEFTEDWAGRGS